MATERGGDPAAVFAVVATQLRKARPSRLDLSRWATDPQVEQSTVDIAASIVQTGRVNPWLLGGRTTNTRSAFMLLRAIDRAFATLDPYTGTRHHGRLGPFRGVLAELGRYNADCRMGAVIPRRTFPARPQSVPDHEVEYFHSLLLVPAPSTSVKLGRVAADLDFTEELLDDDEMIVGCAVFLHHLNELDVRRHDDTVGWYSIRADTARHGMEFWHDRIEDVLANLDGSGANIGVLPELALTDEILNEWKRALLQIEPPPGCPLECILVGTGPLTVEPPAEQPPNRAVVLHRMTGNEVFVQDKNEPFTISDDQIRSWGLADHLGNGPLAEWMLEGRHRHVVDAKAGRFAVLICEDHGRLLTLGSELVTTGPTHFLIPIFAPPILRFRWQEQAAVEFANTIGTVSVVVTSCAVTTPRTAAQKHGHALMVRPDQPGPSSTWSARAELQQAEADPARVLTFSVPRS